ncbi:hypothetical protein FRX31_026112 [Thalictrum thalictroides]|uniref:Defensin-like protein n=1 Tax=Thalictrum thalictroides TaxID=46969 RepID=A0A7J6VHU3_THATH|nr:hypothetical protein FRX31_026112 [Thalictrum thalictroides]
MNHLNHIYIISSTFNYAVAIEVGEARTCSMPIHERGCRGDAWCNETCAVQFKNGRGKCYRPDPSVFECMCLYDC